MRGEGRGEGRSRHETDIHSRHSIAQLQYPNAACLNEHANGNDTASLAPHPDPLSACGEREESPAPEGAPEGAIRRARIEPTTMLSRDRVRFSAPFRIVRLRKVRLGAPYEGLRERQRSRFARLSPIPSPRTRGEGMEVRCSKSIGAARVVRTMADDVPFRVRTLHVSHRMRLNVVSIELVARKDARMSRASFFMGFARRGSTTRRKRDQC